VISLISIEFAGFAEPDNPQLFPSDVTPELRRSIPGPAWPDPVGTG
jgi:hypothetical protein